VPLIRHRGKSPQQLAFFMRTGRARQEAALLASLCRLVGALAEGAWVAVNRNDWGTALRRWERALEIEPERRDAQIGLMQAMRCLGRADRAELMASEALARHPGDPDFLIEHIWCADQDLR
jgi:uncharacterized membrane-anchored protein